MSPDSDRRQRRVTGAWVPGDPPGHRRFFTFATDRRFALEGGGTLSDVVVAYETWGTLDVSGSNAVLLCHAWTGDSHVTGPAGTGHPEPGWWEGMVGPGRPIDTNRWFVVCSNVLGGCQGSTGPATPHPVDGRPYASRFPVITIRDMVRAQARLADHLGVERWHAVDGRLDGRDAGAGVGDHVPPAGALDHPHRHVHAGHGTADRLGGDRAPGDRPRPALARRRVLRAPMTVREDGLAIARMVAQVTFRSDNVFTDRFGRDLVDRAAQGDTFGLWQQFEVERYLEHHGAKLGRRFDTNSYLVIGKAMDLHDVARSRGNLAAAMARVTAASLVLGISSDLLYPNYQQRQIDEMLRSEGVWSRYVEIDSPHGHDAFLINLDQLGDPDRRLPGSGLGALITGRRTPADRGSAPACSRPACAARASIRRARPAPTAGCRAPGPRAAGATWPRSATGCWPS